jgi:hypothetical protein
MYECTHFCKRPCSPLRFLFLCLQQRLCPHVSTSHSIVNTSKFALTLVSFPQYICNTKLLFRKCALFAMCFNCSKFVLNFVGSLSFFLKSFVLFVTITTNCFHAHPSSFSKVMVKCFNVHSFVFFVTITTNYFHAHLSFFSTLALNYFNVHSFLLCDNHSELLQLLLVLFLFVLTIILFFF